MDMVLFDEVLEEIFKRLPPSSSPSISLVSKRWLSLYRTSKTTLSITIPTPKPHQNPSTTLSSLLSHYPHLSFLTLIHQDTNPNSTSDTLLQSVASTCTHLRHLRFLSHPPVSLSALRILSSSCKHLTSLQISSPLPFPLRWLAAFSSLRDLSLLNFTHRRTSDSGEFEEFDDFELPLVTLCLSGLGPSDFGLNWLWRSCQNLRTLRLRSCEGIGDAPASPAFVQCLRGLREVELRTCRSIADWVLLRIAEHCSSLASFLIYDGGSRAGLHQFISQCTSRGLQRLDLRLPLDLDNDHLSAIGRSFGNGLVSLRLQSCCLVTGQGLKSLGAATGGSLEELVLINCDVVEREPGLLTFLGQNLRRLRKLDLSYNDMLLDKELVSMLASCKSLVDIRLRGCGGLTNVSMVSMIKNCMLLEIVDFTRCNRITVEAVEFFIMNSSRLRQILVEEWKLSEVAKARVSQKFIQVG